jgi:hypothetical protein
MATATQPVSSATPAPLTSNAIPHTNGSAHSDDPASLTNGHYRQHHHHLDPRPAPVPTPGPSIGSNKKGKSKKPLDSSEASALVKARISQLEIDNAAEREQEAEIGTSYLEELSG